MKLHYLFISLLLFNSLTACSDDDNKPGTPPVPPDMSGFAKGADVSWITQMEKANVKFYNAQGREMECMRLLRDLGMNTVRLRVWVDPADGWCNKADLLVKAYRAHNLGMRLMIDFHYSDVWADPGSQTKPAAWENLSFDELKTAVADHTTEILTALKNQGITPEWVQVGNETGNGMLWPTDKPIKTWHNMPPSTMPGMMQQKQYFRMPKSSYTCKAATTTTSIAGSSMA